MDTLTTLFSHNLWANLSLLEICKELNDKQLDSILDGTFGSIRETFRHITRAERAYFSRVSTGTLFQWEGDGPFTLDEIGESLWISGEGFIEWAPKIKADDFVTLDWDGKPRVVPKTILLTQSINHATEHRSQIMTILTQLDIQPPDLDGLTYFDAKEM